MSRKFDRWAAGSIAALAALSWLAWASFFGGSGTAGVAAFASGGVAMLPARERVRSSLRAAAERHGLDPDWLDALGWIESRWDGSAVNMTGGDLARGGAWGPTQITATTARAFGYTGPMEALTEDPDQAAELTAKMVEAGFAERAGKVYFYGRPTSADQVASVWNAGRLPGDPTLPGMTVGYMSRLAMALNDLPEAPV